MKKELENLTTENIKIMSNKEREVVEQELRNNADKFLDDSQKLIEALDDYKMMQSCVHIIREEILRKNVIIENLVQYIYDNCAFKGLYYEFLQREFGFTESEAVRLLDKMCTRDEQHN